jgi:hypothetical protein
MDSPLHRIAAIVVLAFLTAVPFTFAAEPRPAAPKAPLRPAPRKLSTLLVPNVEGLVYVFAKGILEDGGFSWYVPGGNGFATNTVVSQSPRPGTRVLNTGAPLVTLKVSSSRGYAERGTPDNKSPYRGTAVRPARSS